MLSSWTTIVGLFLATAAAQTTTGDVIPPWQTGIITEDGTCGSQTPGWVCTPTWGACCSKDGVCGRSKAYCGDGCQVGYGNCDAVAPAPPGPGSPSPDGSCGGTSQYNCTGASYGNCCSSGGWCGSTTAHCGAGCQKLFGLCVDTGNVSTDGQCGAANSKTCQNSTYGNCCSSSGFCGGTESHCGAGCQGAFGTCSSGAGSVSTDGLCGSNGKTCKGSTYGDCCSLSGFCGGTTSHCGSGCQTAFGSCTVASNVTSDGTCGTKNGKVCKESGFGDCCSESGFCGSTAAHCDAGCQATFGTCNAGSSNISTDGQCGSKNGKVCKGSGFGDCCSSSGYCGSASDHCGAGCQTSYGTCSSGAGSISTDGVCGTYNGKTCVGSTFGKCCSSGGFCGNTANHCGQGCQKKSSSACITTNIPSVDGTCGPSKGGWTCNGGDFNNQCCAVTGFCGTTNGHCGTGCQKGYGRCN